MFDQLAKKLTNSYNDVPLFYVMFNLNEYKRNGKRGSCIANVHPVLADDKHVKEKLNELIDYIRDNYDMDELVK